MGNSTPQVRSDSTDVGQRIRKMRDKRGMKQNHLAQEAGISREELSRIERGRVAPTMRTVNSLSDALGVPLGTLLEEGWN